MSSVLNSVGSLIYSALAVDPYLCPIVDEFVEEIPHRLGAMRLAEAVGDLNLLERLAHQLKGAAGSYGFAEVTPSAANLEKAVRSRKSPDEILACLNAVADVCRRIRSTPPADSRADL